jgi:sec-independent protein translocase protein TatA
LAIFGGNIGATEIIVILAICLLLFGANKLPKLARSLGSSMTEFKKGLRGEPSPDDAKKLDEKAETATGTTGEKTKAGEE